jgi:hypothetical protein
MESKNFAGKSSLLIYVESIIVHHQRSQKNPGENPMAFELSFSEILLSIRIFPDEIGSVRDPGNFLVLRFIVFYFFFNFQMNTV